MDARFSISHNNQSGNFSSVPRGVRGLPPQIRGVRGPQSGQIPSEITGKLSSDSDLEVFQARYGLGSGWHVGLALPYVSRAVSKTDYDNPPAHFARKSSPGGQNPSFWATYGLIDGKNSPLSLNGELLLSPDTTGQHGAVYTGQLLAGWKSSDTLKLYSIYSALTSADSSVADQRHITVGAHQDISAGLTLIANTGYGRSSATDTLSATSHYDLGLSAHIGISRDTYLTPAFAYSRLGEVDSKNVRFHRDTAHARGVQLGLYHFF